MKEIYRLLKLEYYKFNKSAVIGLLTMMFLVTMPTVIFIGKEFTDVPEPLPDNRVFFEFPTVWDYQGFIGNWLVFFFMGLIAVFMVTNEVGYKTFRQNIITGMTRKEYFLAKLYSIIAISILSALFYATICLGIGMYHTEGWTLSDAFDNSWAIPRFFLMSFGYTSFGLFVGFVMRRSGLAVLSYLTYIMLIEALLKWAIHFRLIAKNNSINFYPSNCIEDLMPLPFYRFADLIPKKDLDFNFLLSYSEATIGTIIWTFLFLTIAYYQLIKKDI